MMKITHSDGGFSNQRKRASIAKNFSDHYCQIRCTLKRKLFPFEPNLESFY